MFKAFVNRLVTELTLKASPDTLSDSEEAEEATAPQEQGIVGVQAERSPPDLLSLKQMNC